MPSEPLGTTLVALHLADGPEALGAALGCALSSAGQAGFTMLLPGSRPGEFVAALSNRAVDQLEWILADGDPLLLRLDGAGEFWAGLGEASPLGARSGLPLGLSAVLELRGRAAAEPAAAGYLLLHGDDEIPVDRRGDLRLIARHLEAAVLRVAQETELRNNCWNSTEALDAMNEMGRLMGTLDLRLLLTKILQLTLQLGNADVGSIVLMTSGRITSQFEWGFTEEALRSLKSADGTLLVEAVMAGGDAVHIPNVYLDPRLDTGEGMLPIDSLVVLPLVTGNGVLGAINVVNVSEERGFGPDRLSTLKTICSLAAIAIENARFHEEALKNEQLKEQARIAESIQRGFFPRSVPAVAGFDLAGRTEPAQFVGGDYYDWLQLPDGRLGVAVADVSGHGISAGMVMTLTRSYFRAAAPIEDSPAALFKILNRHLMAEDLGGAYVTFMYGVLDTKRGELRFSSAGHVPLVHYVRARDEVDFLELPSVPIGMFDDVEYEEQLVSVAPGDLLLFLTDGVVEAMNPMRQQYGTDRLSALLRRLHAEEPGRLLDALHSAVQRHTLPDQPHDDVTTVLLRTLPQAA